MFINQESVDLNSYLYAEKGFLKSMADVLGEKDDAKKYSKEAKKSSRLHQCKDV